MQFDTKIAVVICDRSRTVADSTSLHSSPVASPPRFRMRRQALWRRIGHEISVADRPADPDLRHRPGRASRALERALTRNVTPAVYTEDMFRTTHDAANREVVSTVIRAELNLVGLAIERKVIDVDGLKFPQLAADC